MHEAVIIFPTFVTISRCLRVHENTINFIHFIKFRISTGNEARSEKFLKDEFLQIYIGTMEPTDHNTE